MKKIGWLMIGMFLAGLIFAQVFLAGLRFEKLVFKRIVDGDTFWVTNFRDGSEWKVRLWGVDSPDQGKCYFDEATKILEQELTTKKITFDRKGYDGYGRILARVYVDGESVEEILVATGAAVAYDASEVHDDLRPVKNILTGLKSLKRRQKMKN